MIRLISDNITDFFISQNIIDEDKKDIYHYGFEIMISSIFNILEIIIAGFVFKSFIESLLFLAIIIPLRLYTGGYHADTYLKCNAVFLICFLAALGVYKFLPINISRAAVLPIILLSDFVIFKFAPIDNPHKRLNETEKKKHRKTAIIISSIISATIITLWVCSAGISLFISLILGITALLILIEIRKRRMLS